MLTYEKLVQRERSFRVLTGMSVAGFEELLPSFRAEFARAKNRRAQRVARERAPGAGAKAFSEEARTHLIFILVYMRQYPMQDLQGMLFGITQSCVSTWVGRLMPVLQAALGNKLVLPQRKVRTLQELLERVPGLRTIIDGTERPVPRPKKDTEKQRQRYSGKKKRHCIKNTVLVQMQSKRVEYLGPTRAGSVHDKAMADEEALVLPPGTLHYQDTGYQGYRPPGARVVQPKKKPRGQPLSFQDKDRNRRISRLRVRVEHGIGGVKHYRITRDIFRNRATGLEDTVMEVACGLYNYRLQYPLTQTSAASALC